LTCTPAFAASSTIALRTSISSAGGAGSGVRAISPVYLIPFAARARTASRAACGVVFRIGTCPDGMMRGPLIIPESMWSRSAMLFSACPPPASTVV
jgi:hypothetical protein